MSEKHDLEQNDSLRDYYKEIGDGMEPPAHLVQAAKTGVFANPAAKPSTHVWRFTKAVACYALGIALFLGAIAFLPRLFEGLALPGTQVTVALTDGTDFFNLPEDVRAEAEAAYAKHFGLRSFPGWLETGGYVHYYGTFNRCVVMFHSSMLPMVEQRDIAGYLFSNGNQFTLMAYKDGELLDLEDAYAEGWMTKEDIGEIHQQHLKRNDRDADEVLQNAMRKVYAKQFDVNEESITIRQVKNLSEGCGVFVDVAGTDYGKTAVEETVYGLTFRYPDSQRMLFYHGTRYYTLTDAAKQGVISGAGVRALYLEYNAEALQKLEKLTCDATQWDTFTSGKVVFTVHPEFNAYQYTKDDFPYMSLISIEELTSADPDHPEQGKTLLLTMKYDSPKNTLSYVKYLENEPDVYSAMPYGYGEWTPDTPHPPVIEPDPPMTEPVEDIDYCLKKFERGLGKSVAIDRNLTPEEIERVRAFFNQKDANLALACVYKPFYNPKNISLYELIYASDIKTEFPDNPYQNDGSMMTAHRIKSLVLQYFGYEVPQTMFRELLLEGVEYFPESDAYGFAHTDTSGFVPSNPMYGYRLDDGYWLVHLCAFEEEGDHVMVMLNPRVTGFYIAAGQLVDRKDVFKEPERPVTPPVQLPTESMKETILRQYAQKYGKDLSKLSLRVIGQYSDNYIVFVDDADTLYPDKFTTDMVAGYDFRYGTAQTLLVYRSLNGRFYTLFDAYKDGLLTSTTIRTLYNQYKTKYPDLYNSDYFHQAIGQEAAKAYAKEYGKDLSKLSVRVAGVFLRFDGDYFAVFVDEAGVRYENKPSQEVVGGKVFRYSTTQRLLIYTDGKFYSLAEFYEKDLIPYSDLYEQYRTYQSHLYEDSYVYPLIEKEMVSQYAHMYGKQESKLTAQLIYTYTYQNVECYVLFMNDQDQPSENRLIGQRVGEHIFYSRAPQTLLVYYDGCFYTLSKAYEDTMDVALLNVPKLSTLYLHYRSLYPELYEESYLQQIAEAEIKQLCVKQYGKGKASDYTVRFMTSYLDAYVVYVDGKYVADQAVSTQRVGGLLFAYPNQKAMKVYWDGRFYALADALEQQVIDYDTVKRLYSLHEAELVKGIVKTHQKVDGCSKAVDSHRIEFVAQMDDRYAIYVHCPGLSYTAAMTTVTINGLDFVYGSSHMIEIYHNGKMYSVQSAFEKGILSENQLRYLYEIHRGNYDYPYVL